MAALRPRAATPDSRTTADKPIAMPVATAPEPLAADDLSQIIRAYNEVTDRLQRNHETLQNEVLRLREELASTNAQLQRSKRLSALGEMAAGIAHEIRNPLAAIQLYASMVGQDLRADPPVFDTAAENNDKIAAAVRGLNAIVVDVLSFAKEITPRPEAVAAEGLLLRVVESHRPVIEAAGVDVRIDVHEGAMLHVDPQLLHQALLNLVRNAVDAVAERESPRRLRLRAQAYANRVCVTIQDTGPGIDETQIDRIFNPFFTTRSTGTGLGLAIVHRIVDAHGGSIAVVNDPDTGGAVFTLELAAARSAEQHGAVA